MSNDDTTRPSQADDEALAETSEPESDDLDQDEATADQAASDRTSSGGMGLVSTLLVVLLVVGGAGYAAYRWHQQHHGEHERELSAELDSVKQQLAALAALSTAEAPDDSATQITALETALAGLHAQADKAARQQQQLEQSVAGLYQEESQTSLDWVLAEAEYLVLAANQRLALEGDVNTALAALKAADQRLSLADHPDLIPIRDRLIEEASALQAVKLPDIEGLAIYLAKVIEQVDELPTKPLAESVKPFAETKRVAAQDKDWRRVLNSMWTDLVELVEIKDAALPDSVLFDPELKYFLQQNLKIELSSARLAVLDRDGENFRASAALVKKILGDFYDPSAGEVSSIIERLTEAEAYEFAPALPKITASLDAIRAGRKASGGGGGQ